MFMGGVEKKLYSGSNAEEATRKRIEKIFDEYFDGSIGINNSATVFEPCASNLSLREKADKAVEKTVFAKTILLEESLLKKIKTGSCAEKKKDEEERVSFPGGYFKKAKQLSSKYNAVGDVSLAVKVYIENGKEREGELVVLKTMKSEEEILGRKDIEDLSVEEKELLDRLYLEAGREIKNLERFKDNEHIASPTGDVIIDHKRKRLIAQIEYVPHSINNYLWNISGEKELSDTIFDVAIQMLDTISYLENYKDKEAPFGWVNNDFKLGNVGIAIKDGRVVAKMLDLDSIRPISEMISVKRETKYSIEYCDPEKFMELHNHEVAMNAKPDETIYSLGLVLLYSISERMAVRLNDRHLIVFPVEYEEMTEMERTTRVSVTNPEDLKAKLERARETDELNLLKTYLVNKNKRAARGKKESDPPEIKKLLTKHAKKVVSEIEPYIREEMKWPTDYEKKVGKELITPPEMVRKNFMALLYSFAVDDKTADMYDAKTQYERLVLGMELNTAKLTEKYARNTYEWYTGAVMMHGGWYAAITKMFEDLGLKREDVARIVKLAKREELGRDVKSTFKPFLFEGIAYCIKARKERPNAADMKKIFQKLKKEWDDNEV